MSDKAPITVVGMGAELGYGGYRAPPFTDVQWKELEQQAMIYKYMVAGIPVPPDLVSPIRHSFEGLYSHIFNHPACKGLLLGVNLCGSLLRDNCLLQS